MPEVPPAFHVLERRHQLTVLSLSIRDWYPGGISGGWSSPQGLHARHDGSPAPPQWHASPGRSRRPRAFLCDLRTPSAHRHKRRNLMISSPRSHCRFSCTLVCYTGLPVPSAVSADSSSITNGQSASFSRICEGCGLGVRRRETSELQLTPIPALACLTLFHGVDDLYRLCHLVVLPSGMSIW